MVPCQVKMDVYIDKSNARRSTSSGILEFQFWCFITTGGGWIINPTNPHSNWCKRIFVKDFFDTLCAFSVTKLILSDLMLES